MFLPFQNREELLAVCDIGGARIKVVVFSASKKKRKATLVDYYEQEFSGEEKSREAYFAKALSALSKFLGALGEKIGKHPQTVLVSLPHGFTVTRRVQFRTERPDPKAELRGPELEEIWKAHGSEILKIPDDLTRGEEWAPLMYELENVFLDGYSFEGGGYGSGRELLFSVLVSFWPQGMQDIFEGQAISMRLAPVACPRLMLIRDYLSFLYGKNLSGVLCDMSAEDCMVAVFTEGQLFDFAAFPFGGADMTRAIAKAFGVSFSDAETTKRQWSGGALKKETATKIETALVPLVQFWKREWALFLEHAAEHSVIRPHFFLSGGGAASPLLGATLLDPAWYRHFATDEPGEITRVTESEVPRAMLPHWPVHSMNDVVIFGLISRMIQRHL